MEEEKLCLCGNKSVLTLDHGPKGKKGGQGSIDDLFVSFSYHYVTYFSKLK